MPWRALRWWLLIPGGALLLMVLALIGLVLFVNPDRFRPRIEAAITAQTGWTVAVGELHWRLWPRLAIELGEGSIGVAPAPPPLHWRAVTVAAQWRPLLHGEVLLDRVRIDGLMVALAVDADGRGNWRSLLDRLQAQSARPSSQAARPLQLDELALSDAEIDFTDARSAAHWHAARTRLALRLQFSRDAVRIGGLTFSAQVSGGPWQGATPVAFVAPEVRWANPTLTLPVWTLSLANVALQGQQHEPVRLTPLSASGQLRLHTSSLRTLLTTLSMQPPPTRDRAVFGDTDLTTEWQWRRDTVDLSSLSVRVDGLHLTGQAHWTRQPRPLLTLQLAGGEVDLDRYLAPPDYVSAPFQLPAVMLKSLPVTGTIAFDSARVQGAILRGVRLRLVSEEAP